MKKLTLIFTAALIVTALIASCGKNGEQSRVTDPAGTTNDLFENGDIVYTDRKSVPDNLPVKNYEGRVFNILLRTQWDYEFVAESDTAEPVNDAVYRRNIEVSERFGVVIKPIAVPGDWNNREAFMTKVRSAVMAGDTTYDLIAGYGSYICTLLPEGIFINLNELDHLNFEKPWWSYDSAKELSVGGKLYLVTGDIALSMWKHIHCMFFNKQMIADLGMDSPYDLVKSNKWTLDKLTEMVKASYRSITGKPTPQPGDQYGIAFEDTHLVYNWQYAFNQPATMKDENDIPYVVVDNPKTEAIMSKMLDFLYYTEGVLFTRETSTLPENPYSKKAFQEDRIVFVVDYLGNAEVLRNMDADFGIIPYPKWDESQEKYATTIHNAISLFGIPASVSDPECSAIIMEALCAESYKNVVPAFYDVTLKGKITRDEESEEMIDLIRDSLSVNYGYMFANATGDFGKVLHQLVRNPNLNYGSWMAANKESKMVQFNKFIDNLLDLTD